MTDAQRDPTDGKIGYRPETVASIQMRTAVVKYFTQFGLFIRNDRTTGQAVASVFIDALAGTLAYIIAGKHGSKEEVINATVTKLREAVERDLTRLRN